ncbi:MAG: DMT family transporter [Anaerolineales bacterium]|nr:MAG: DMT family transporter [Anaerolineales bacterium]
MPSHPRAVKSNLTTLRNTTRLLAILAGLLAVTFWGASFVATKLVLRQITPPTIVFIRTSIGLVVLTAAAVGGGSFKERLTAPWPRLLILGFLGVAFHQWLQARGLQSTSATSSGWIIATIPIFVALLGWRFLGERLPLIRLLGIGFGALGVITVISGGHILRFLQGFAGQIGNAYILLSAVNWAVFTVLTKRWLFNQAASSPEAPQQNSASFAGMIQSMWILMIMGWAIMLPWAIADGGIREIFQLSNATIGALLFLGVACSGLAYIFWYMALTRIEATEVGALLYFEPLVTQAVAWPLLGEPLTPAIMLGGAAIFLGVWMVSRGRAG